MTPLDALVNVLLDALRTLGSAGQAEVASCLGGRAYAALRRDHPDHAERINALMHHLTRKIDHAEGAHMPTPDPRLDVRAEPPARRHALIFDTYDGLDAGHGFVLVNDHDPKPLYYQFAAEHPGQFTWDPIEQGPEVWQVRIGRAAAGDANAA